jgi:2-oxo-4-hydroxy-4-carboxy-5-ureidoimidazoline decarboxylase
VPDTPLERFNTEPAERAEEVLRACNAAPSFAAEVAAGRPYADADALVARAERVSRALPWAEVAAALAAHPRIGGRVEGASAEAAVSRREQSGMGTADAELRAAMVEANRAYEERFDQVFLIRAAGRSAAEMLTELGRRLGNSPEDERAEVTEQLAQITGLRVRGIVSSATATGERALQGDAGSRPGASIAASAGERGAERPRRRPMTSTEERDESGAEPVN